MLQPGQIDAVGFSINSSCVPHLLVHSNLIFYSAFLIPVVFEFDLCNIKIFELEGG